MSECVQESQVRCAEACTPDHEEELSSDYACRDPGFACEVPGDAQRLKSRHDARAGTNLRRLGYVMADSSPPLV